MVRGYDLRHRGFDLNPNSGIPAISSSPSSLSCRDSSNSTNNNANIDKKEMRTGVAKVIMHADMEMEELVNESTLSITSPLLDGISSMIIINYQ